MEHGMNTLNKHLVLSKFGNTFIEKVFLNGAEINVIFINGLPIPYNVFLSIFIKRLISNNSIGIMQHWHCSIYDIFEYYGVDKEINDIPLIISELCESKTKDSLIEFISEIEYNYFNLEA